MYNIHENNVKNYLFKQRRINLSLMITSIINVSNYPHKPKLFLI
jgi:hypothetical protein